MFLFIIIIILFKLLFLECVCVASIDRLVCPRLFALFTLEI